MLDKHHIPGCAPAPCRAELSEPPVCVSEELESVQVDWVGVLAEAAHAVLSLSLATPHRFHVLVRHFYAQNCALSVRPGECHGPCKQQLLAIMSTPSYWTL